MDNLKGFEKIYLGASDIATLIAVGCKESYQKKELIIQTQIF